MMAMRPKSSLPPGFRFHPTDVELVCYYLKRKVMEKPFHFQAVSVIELYKHAPWDLPAMSLLRSNDLEWYFFCPRDKKYPNGSRANRATDIGYWKATGKDRSVTHNLRTIGKKKTLIFHIGKPPKGDRTDWVMYEYRLDDSEVANAGFSQDAYVLCKIFQKSGLGPKIGEEYGAPFNEEEWEDDMITDNSFSPPFPSCSLSRPVINEPMPLNTVCQQPDTDTIAVASSNLDGAFADGMSLEDLTELSPFSIIENTFSEMPNPAPHHGTTTENSAAQPEEFFNELEDLYAQVATSAEIDYPDTLLDENVYCPVLSQLYNEDYVELNDLGFLNKFYPSESVDAYALLSQHQLTHQLSSQDTSNMYDHSYFNNDFTMSELHSSNQSEAKHVERSSVTLQIQDYEGSVNSAV